MAFLLMVCSSILQAQGVQIKGKVTSSEDGSALPGASVVVKGTSVASVTDADGNFSITAPAEATTLVFNFIGMKTQEVEIAGQTTLNIVLEPDVVGLEEVVVTALGISKEKKALGYAVQDVKGDDINQARETNIVNALSGRVAGVQVTGATGNMGGSSRITVRGAHSVTGNNSPLFVVDGVPFDNSDYNTANTARGAGGYDYGNMAQDINPNDIESMSVLKGPQAAALYGSRASNGVIVITTKKGKMQKNKALGITFNSSVSWEQIAILPKYQNQYGGGYSLTPLGYNDNTGYYKTSYTDEDGNTYSSFDLIPDYAIDESWGPAYSTKAGEYLKGNYDIDLTGPQANEPLMYRAWNSWDSWDKDNFGKSIQWKTPDKDIRDFFETGITYTNSIDMTGGNDISSFRVSYTNMDLKGYMPNSTLKRNSVSLNGNSKLGRVVNIFGTVNFTNNEAKGRPSTGYDDNNIMQKFNQWGQRSTDMGQQKAYKNPDGTQRTWNRSSWDDPTPAYSDNPYWTRYENYQSDTRNRVFGNVGFSINIFEWLKFQTKAMADYYNLREMERVAIGSQAQSKYAETTREFFELNTEYLFLFDKKFGDDFSLNGTFGGNRMSQEYNRNNGITKGGLLIPNFYNLSNSASPAATGDYSREKAINSVLGNITLGYQSMVYIDFAARNDWSSTLPKESNSYFYPAITGSFIFTEISGLNELPALSYGKLRAGWAQVGNDTDPYRTLSNYVSAIDDDLYPYTFNGLGLYSISETLNNSKLKPEITSSIEFGAELKFFENRLGIDFTYFTNTTKDQILPVQISPASGYRYKVINAGEMKNNGIELLINATPLKIGDFQWDITLNYSKIENEVVSLAEGVDNYRLANAPFAVSVNAKVGEPYGVILGTDYIVDNNGNKVVNTDGLHIPSEVKSLGSVMPDWTGSINNTFRYKGFDIGALIDIRQGGKFFSTTYMWGIYSGILEETAEGGIRENGKVVEGVYGDYDPITKTITYLDKDGNPSATPVQNTTNVDAETWAVNHYDGPNSQNVFDASYVKLREIRLGYTIPSRFTGFIQNVRLSAFGRNLATWGTSIEHVDPENTTSSGNVQGLEGGALPSLRTFGVSLNCNF